MAKYISKKILNLIPVVIISTIFIFFMVKASGVNPVLATTSGGRLTAESLQNKMAKYGMDKSLPMQYIYWLKNIFTGNFGESVQYKTSVSSLIQNSAPVTAGLAIISFIISQPIAILLGVLAAVKKNTIVDTIISVITLILFAIPIFFLSMLVILYITKNFPGYSYTGGYNSVGGYFTRIIIPALIISFHQIALVTKITRSSMIDQLNSDYVLTLKAKGLSKGKIIFKHALKNGIIPVITVSGIQFGAMIVGCVLVENIFSLSGLGKLMVQSVSVGDISVIQGIAMIIILVFLLSNLVVDLLYAVIDPRIRRGNENA